MLKFLIGIPVIGVVISFIINILLVIMLQMVYSGLTKENLVATVYFDTDPKQQNAHIAHLADPEGDKIGDYEIYGDQWRMDVWFFKMKPWANILGFDAKYSLDRFEGRYSDTKDQNTKKTKAYQLEDHFFLDQYRKLEDIKVQEYNLGILLDTSYGSSTFKYIKPNTLYSILHSPTGLLIREKHIEEEAEEKSFFDEAMDYLPSFN